MMRPRFRNNQGHGYALRCPACGGDFLHHDRIDVYEPCHEDAETGQHVTVEWQGTSITTDLAGNPSGRRNGLTIRFWCEGCAFRPVLHFLQHKGTTYVHMTAIPEDEKPE